jgi:hypothetical protein
MVQVVEHLPGKYKALSSNLNTEKKNQLISLLIKRAMNGDGNFGINIFWSRPASVIENCALCSSGGNELTFLDPEKDVTLLFCMVFSSKDV